MQIEVNVKITAEKTAAFLSEASLEDIKQELKNRFGFELIEVPQFGKLKIDTDNVKVDWEGPATILVRVSDPHLSLA